MKQFELGEYVTDDLYGDEPYPVVGEIISIRSQPYEPTHVTVRAPYVGDIELRIEDIRYANSEPHKRTPSRTSRVPAKVGDIVTGTTIDGDPIIGYITRLHTYPSIRVCTKPGHYVDVDLATAIVVR